MLLVAVPCQARKMPREECSYDQPQITFLLGNCTDLTTHLQST